MASTLISKTLYNGLHEAIHNPDAKGRQPRYTIDGTSKEGVTTIIGGTLFKDLTGWALSCMEDILNGKLPTITAEDIVFAKGESGRRRDSGAGTGTEAHAMVENYLKGQISDGRYSKEATNAYNAFVEWFEDALPIVVNVEEVIYSERYDFCGTYDCMLEIDGKVYLCDLKTTNASRNAPQGVYPENFVQMGAYALGHEEQRQYEEAHGGTNLRKIDDLMVISARKDGKLDIVVASELGLSVELCGVKFTEVLSLYRFMSGVKKVLGRK